MIAQMIESIWRLHWIRHRKGKKNTKSAGRQKTSFPKEKVENADLYKPVLNKIMATEE